MSVWTLLVIIVAGLAAAGFFLPISNSSKFLGPRKRGAFSFAAQPAKSPAGAGQGAIGNEERNI